MSIPCFSFCRRRRERFSLLRRLGIQGPEPSLFFGNLKELYTLGYTKAFDQWRERYGPTFGYYYGIKPVIVTTNTDLLSQILIKDANLFYNRIVRIPFVLLVYLTVKSKLFNDGLAFLGMALFNI